MDNESLKKLGEQNIVITALNAFITDMSPVITANVSIITATRESHKKTAAAFHMKSHCHFKVAIYVEQMNTAYVLYKGLWKATKKALILGIN